MSKGIYQIKNKTNDIIYIGSSGNIRKRWGVHKRDLNKNIHKNTHLQRAWNKYGSDNFEFIILEEVDDVNMLSKIEQEYFNRLNPFYPNGYNISHDTVATMRGMRFSEDHCKKISDANKGEKNHMYGKHPTETTRKKMSETQKRLGNKPPSWKGMKFYEDHCRNISESKKGVPFSESHKINLSKSHKGLRPWMWGKHFTQTARKRMSDAQHIYQKNKKEVWRVMDEKFLCYGGLLQ